MKFATKPTQHYSPHLRHVATYVGKLKIQIFCRHSADMEKMQTNGIILSAPILIQICM